MLVFPPLLAGCLGLNFNNDVQIPYRFPITQETHRDDVCCEECWKHMDTDEMILAAQTQQNAQAGYAADYQCKRCAQSFNEVKEFKKGHHALAETVKDRGLCYIGHRHASRILSDYYGRGVVRSNQESVNIRAYRNNMDVTAAESMKTSKTILMPGAEAVIIVERYHSISQELTEKRRSRAQLDFRDHKTYPRSD